MPIKKAIEINDLAEITFLSQPALTLPELFWLMFKARQTFLRTNTTQTSAFMIFKRIRIVTSLPAMQNPPTSGWMIKPCFSLPNALPKIPSEPLKKRSSPLFIASVSMARGSETLRDPC